MSGMVRDLSRIFPRHIRDGAIFARYRHLTLHFVGSNEGITVYVFRLIALARFLFKLAMSFSLSFSLLALKALRVCPTILSYWFQKTAQ